jgi:hypothetical protein
MAVKAQARSMDNGEAVSFRRWVAYALAVLVVISLIASAIATRGFNHLPFVLEAWALVGLFVVALFRIRRWITTGRNRSV